MSVNMNKVVRLKDIITIAQRVQAIIDIERERINDIEDCLHSIQAIASSEITN